MKKSLSPFQGNPRTKQTTDEDGNIKFIVYAEYITPERYFISLIIARILIFITAINLIQDNYNDYYEYNFRNILITAAILYGVYVWFKFEAKLILSKTKTIEITKDFIVVKGLFKSRVFSRDIPHKFSIIPHDKTQRENDKFDFNRGKKRNRLYSASYHLSLDYMGQRNDLITIYEHKNAMAIASRLTACCEVASASTGLTGGTPISPKQQWDNSGGEID